MKKKFLWIAVLVVIGLLFAGATLLYNNLIDDYNPGGFEETDDGTKFSAPDFMVYDESGQKAGLSDYKGKPVVLNFWASWCPPCKAEMPHFEAAYKEHPDVQFMMVNMTTSDRESLEAAQNFISENGYTFPVFYDTEGEAAHNYAAYSLPVTYFIDEEGYLVTYGLGMLDAAALDQGIEMIK